MKAIIYVDDTAIKNLKHEHLPALGTNFARAGLEIHEDKSLTLAMVPTQEEESPSLERRIKEKVIFPEG